MKAAANAALVNKKSHSIAERNIAPGGVVFT